jgi:hypothetical protein
MPFQRLYSYFHAHINMTYLGYFGALLGACYVALAQNQTGGSGDSVSTTSSELNFGPVNFGGYNNYVYRDNTTAVQVVVSEYVNHSLKDHILEGGAES